MKNPLTRLIGIAMLALFAHTVYAAGAESSPVPATDALASVREHLAAKKWTAAIDELKRINDTGNADWNNLMGYSLRKAAKPDFAGAERHYNDALRINSQHRGALEYSGELYLMTNNLPMAEKRLSALNKACFLPCAEYTQLKQAVERYKAAGNQYNGNY
jgi:hypothetical protein